jgi:hypothetical protein
MKGRQCEGPGVGAGGTQPGVSSPHWGANIGLHYFKHLEESAVRRRWREMDETATGRSVPELAVLSLGFGIYFYVPVSPACTVPSAVLCASYSRVWYTD